MAESSSFFNSISGDRKYKAEQFAKYFATLIGNGVFPNPSTGCQIVYDSAMAIKQSTGSAWINGYFYNNDADLSLNIGTADGVLHRKDNIVLRWDSTARSISAQVIAGTPGSSPAAPALVRTAEQYDIKLAEVYIAAGTTAITQAMITDYRQDSAACGIVTGLIDQIDVTNLFAQYGAAFTDWFDEIKGQLSTDAAGALQNQINNITGSFAHSLTTTVHALTGTFPVSSGICTIKFKATAGYTNGDTFTVNGTAYTAAMQGGESLDTNAFVTGDVVQIGVDIDAHKLVFKGGGVVLTGNATPPYVANGYTFYSNDAKTKLTGTGAAAKRYAIGTVTSSISTVHLTVWDLLYGDTTSGYSFASVSLSLDFSPSVIFLKANSTYNSIYCDAIYSKDMRYYSDYNLYIVGQSIRNFLFKITDSSLLRVFAPNTQYTYYAWE